ncbi:Non-heme chloroperoxidase [Citrobacter braakii]|nr:Non-heme chloroperoxidase [Citrobacter braakii]
MSQYDKLTLKDGSYLHFKDWGSGQPIVFSHGWPLTADAFEDQMLFLGSKGFRVIAHGQAWAWAFSPTLGWSQYGSVC